MVHKKFVSAGGTTKTIICPCDLRFKGNERDVNYRYKLHQIKCEKCKSHNITQNIFKDSYINPSTLKQVEIRTF